MKTLKLMVALASCGIAAVATANEISTGALAGTSTDEGGANGATASGVSAIAIAASCQSIAVMQAMQGMTCGDFSASCAPNLSSAELRALANADVSDTNSLVSAANGSFEANRLTATVPASCTAAALGANTVIQFRDNNDTADGFRQFVGGAEVLGGTATPLTIGAGSSFAPTGAQRTDDADCIGNLNSARVRFCPINATSLGDASIGFVKVDGKAPTLANLISSNYNVVSNLHGTVPTATVDAYGGTFGAYASGDGDMNGDGVAYHQAAGGTAFAAAPLSPRGSILDADSH